VKSRATPWFKRYGLTMEQLRTTRAAEGWHLRYGKASSAGSASVLRGDETY
jgi:hypothetical protein